MDMNEIIIMNNVFETHEIITYTLLYKCTLKILHDSLTNYITISEVYGVLCMVLIAQLSTSQVI